MDETSVKVENAPENPAGEVGNGSNGAAGSGTSPGAVPAAGHGPAAVKQEGAEQAGGGESTEPGRGVQVKDEARRSPTAFHTPAPAAPAGGPETTPATKEEPVPDNAEETGKKPESAEEAEKKAREERRRRRWSSKDADAKPRRKRSRWASPPTQSMRCRAVRANAAAEGAVLTTRPTLHRVSPAGPSSTQMQLARLQLRLQDINRRLSTVAQDAAKREQDPDRTPSPPPVYDSVGKRLNTREIRMRNALNSEQQSVMREMVKLNPELSKVAGFGGPQKLERRIYFPVEEYPDYNFMGRIIGPRGNTHRRLEAQTGCRISIRGKGSVKEGRGRRDGRLNGDENDKLHVLIMGEDEKKVQEVRCALARGGVGGGG